MHQPDSSSRPTVVQQLPRLLNDRERRSSQAGFLHNVPPESPNRFSASQNSSRTGRGHTPPLLTSESTSGTTKSTESSASTGSYYAPTTPLEPSIHDRRLPIPTLFPSKPPGLYDTHLPPIQAPSLSPQSSINVSYQPSSGNQIAVVHYNALADVSLLEGILSMDYSSSNTRRSYLHSPQPQPHLASSIPSAHSRNVPTSAVEETPLDPVSALLKAGEIFDRKSQNNQRQ